MDLRADADGSTQKNPAAQRGEAGQKARERTADPSASRSRNADAARNVVPPQEVPPSREDLLRQFELVDKSLDYLGLVLAAILVNYYTVQVQKEQIAAALEEKSDPYANFDFFPFQLSSAVMLLSSASFFFGVSEDALTQPQTDPVILESLQLNNYINASVLVAAVARIYNLMLVKFAPHPPVTTPAEEEEEEEVELEDSLL